MRHRPGSQRVRGSRQASGRCTESSRRRSDADRGGRRQAFPALQVEALLAQKRQRQRDARVHEVTEHDEDAGHHLERATVRQEDVAEPGGACAEQHEHRPEAGDERQCRGHDTPWARTDLVEADARYQREVAGHQRRHARGQEREEARGEGRCKRCRPEGDHTGPSGCDMSGHRSSRCGFAGWKRRLPGAIQIGALLRA